MKTFLNSFSAFLTYLLYPLKYIYIFQMSCHSLFISIHLITLYPAPIQCVCILWYQVIAQ